MANEETQILGDNLKICPKKWEVQGNSLSTLPHISIHSLRLALSYKSKQIKWEELPSTLVNHQKTNSNWWCPNDFNTHLQIQIKDDEGLLRHVSVSLYPLAILPHAWFI